MPTVVPECIMIEPLDPRLGLNPRLASSELSITLLESKVSVRLTREAQGGMPKAVVGCTMQEPLDPRLGPSCKLAPTKLIRL